MSQMFEIKRITNVNWTTSSGTPSKTKATLDLIIKPHGIVIRDCRLVEWNNGFFVSSPSKELKEPWTNDEGKVFTHMDIAFFPKEVRDELNAVAQQAYDPHATTVGNKHTAEADVTFGGMPL